DRVRYQAPGSLNSGLPGAPETQALQHYLLSSSRFLLNDEAYGLPQSALYSAAYQSDALVDEEDRYTLLDDLALVRRQVKAQLARLVEQSTPRPYLVNVDGDVTGLLVIGGDVTDYTHIEIKDSTLYGPVAKTIEGSFNTVAASSVPETLKAELKLLTKATWEMLETAQKERMLSPEQQQDVARDLKELTDEATSERPQTRRLEFSADGLKKVAEKLAEIGVPVVKLVASVLALLA
ncbi:MAG: hypothetical protein OEU32_14805, partial [Acidimicrobiia bacterium]|nr:hypothetical protein [Acidimicrobiia bacterium]